ncbi:hypothetical protein HYT18_00130 [Candidatus Microgenomates bacterium]|nr:hypothetical protein [Candidatus Microgenomates bacterium]
MRKIFLIGAISSILFVVVFLNQLILNIDKPLSDTDLFYEYFLLDNNLSKFVSLDFQHLYDLRMFYPMSKTLSLGNSQFIQSAMALPVYILTKNVIVSAHSMVLINFFLAFLLMYLLIFQLTKSVSSSIVGGLIFTYNPYAMAQFYFAQIVLFWMPLIFLVTEKILEKRKKWVAILPFLFLGQLISSFYYSTLLALTWPVYWVIRGGREIRRIMGMKWGLVGLIVAVVIGFLYLQPYLGVKKEFGVSPGFANIVSHSATFKDFFSTIKDNKLYGQILGTKYSDYSEHSLFAGFVVYGLVIVSLFLFFKRKYEPALRKVFIALIAVWIIAFIFSFGPYFIIGETLIPNIYLLFYKFVPFFDSLRAPSRFMVMGFFSYAILAGFAVKWLLERWSVFAAPSPKLWSVGDKASADKGRLGVILGLVFLISLEYQHSLLPVFKVNPEVKSFYQWLDKQPQINVILELPIANELSNYPSINRSYFDDSKYLLYALGHKKKLINGNAAYNPPQRTLLGQSLTINFPTKDKINQLKSMKVDAIIVHKDEYINSQTGEELIRKLKESNLKEIYTGELVSAFKI